MNDLTAAGHVVTTLTSPSVSMSIPLLTSFSGLLMVSPIASRNRIVRPLTQNARGGFKCCQGKKLNVGLSEILIARAGCHSFDSYQNRAKEKHAAQVYESARLIQLIDSPTLFASCLCRIVPCVALFLVPITSLIHHRHADIAIAPIVKVLGPCDVDFLC